MNLRKFLNIAEVIEIAVVGWWFITGVSPALLHKDKTIPTYLDLTVTSYRAIPAQTDTSPNWTAIGSPAIMGICAASQDLLKSGRLHYGDVILIHGIGTYLVADTMNLRHTNHVDILVYTKTQERLIGWRKHQMVRVLNVEN